MGGVAEVVWVLRVRGAFGKECGDERGGLRPHKNNRVVYERGDECGRADFENGVVPNAGRLAQGGNVHVEADEAGAIEPAENSQERERDELKVVPAAGVLDLVEDELAGAEWVHELQRHGGNHGSNEALPHRLVREVVGELFEAEEHAADGRAESYRDAGGGGGREDLAFTGLVSREVSEGLHKDVGATASNVDEWAFFPEPEAGGDGKALGLLGGVSE